MKRKFVILAVGLVSLSFLNACVNTDTPQYRIDKNYTAFSALPSHEQGLVEEGKLCEGMDTKAVFLAWGYPNTPPFVGNKNGKSMTRWVYTSLEPVMSPYLWRGPSWSPYGWYDPAYQLDAGFASFVPRKTASVLFEDGKVVSWESEKKNW